MDSGNTAIEAIATADETARLRARVAELEAQLGDNFPEVARPQFGGEVPKYKLNAAVFLENDTRYEEGTVLDYMGTPNDDMVPLNDAALARMRSYLDHLTGCAREAAVKNGRAFTGLITDKAEIIALATQDARKAAKEITIAMPEDRGAPPQMPHTPEAHAKKRGRPPKANPVVSANVPAPPSRPGPQPVAILGRDHTQAAAGNKVG